MTRGLLDYQLDYENKISSHLESEDLNDGNQEEEESLEDPRDKEYDIWIRGKVVKIYCSGMSTGSPLEYLTLPGHLENFSEMFSRR